MRHGLDDLGDFWINYLAQSPKERRETMKSIAEANNAALSGIGLVAFIAIIVLVIKGVL